MIPCIAREYGDWQGHDTLAPKREIQHSCSCYPSHHDLPLQVHALESSQSVSLSTALQAVLMCPPMGSGTFLQAFTPVMSARMSAKYA